MTWSEAQMGSKPEAVRVWLLGGFRVSVGSRTIQQNEWRLKKAASLVKLLALAPGHRLHREQAMDLLWPDSSTRAASNNLRQVLYGARRILDPASDSHKSYLSVQDEQLTLCPETQLWVDVDAFEEAAKTARRARDPAVYRAAIDLYAGDLLPEDRYEEWVENRREELRQLYLALLIGLAGLYEERDEHGLAIEALRRATAKEPTLEEAHAALMRLHALSGRPEQALAQYERLRDTLVRGLGTQPGATARRLRDEIATGRFSPTLPAGPVQEEPSDPRRHNLPAQRTSFVGREREMVEVKRLLSMTRLLTLTGTGGSGKTRLALEVARSLVGAYLDGVWLVELAPLSEGDLLTQEVAGTLEVQEQPGQPLTNTLLDTLGDKELLLVVDNCEHLVEATAQLMDTLLDSCPRLRVLATSREPLDISGEVNRPVPTLSLPGTTDGGSDGRPNEEFTLESLMRYEAVRLFVDRARLRLPDFEVTQENAGAVARVCRKLEGIPLAIELATARMGALAVEQVAQRLEVSLDVLKGASRSAEPRQQTLRATLDWSYNLLSEVERGMFRRLSVFAGGWTLEAAEAVCLGDGIEQEDILDLLGGLVDKSLVVAGEATGGSVRYRMLEPIRQYAREKLEESGEADEVQGWHAAFFFAVAEEAKPELFGPQQNLWVERLEREHDNLREALSWVLEREEAELGHRFGGALWRFWHTGGHLSEGIAWLERVLAGGELVSAPARVKALEGMGWLVQLQGDTERAVAAYEEMLKLSRELDDKGNVATALNSLGTLAVARGDNERARVLLEENLQVLRQLEEEGNAATTLKRYHALNLLGILAINEEDDYARGAALWEESLALAREAGDTYRVGASLQCLGYAALLQGNYEQATALCEETLVVARELGSAGVEIMPETLINLGLAARARGEHKRAIAFLEEALTIAQEAGRKASVINALEGIAGSAGALEDNARAARLWGAAETAREVIGVVLPRGERALHEPHLAAARPRLGERKWEEALAEGQAMSLEEAAEYALAKEKSKEESGPPATPVSEEPPVGEPVAKLTDREQEVVVLVAQGFTNRQVSTELGISERTTGNHVARILRKLGLRSRVQIAGWATEHRMFTTNPD
jgi:predicted ATPase/DNA-binding SARP family transcriptional activator/DNA-binding CsgD family transcriptional regulator